MRFLMVVGIAYEIAKNLTDLQQILSNLSAYGR